MILIIISALISSVVMILLMPINIKKLNKIAIDKELNKISEKYPDNMEICKEILKKMENEKTQIEENIESDSTLYIALQDKIYLGNMHGSFTRIQTIAHECLHSIQDRKVLIFNFIFSNIYILYFIISSILIIIKKLPNELVFSNILLIISMLYYAIRMFLENDAMTKSEYLAKEYLKEKKILDEEEVKKIGKGLEELNKGAIIATNSSLFIKIMLKVTPSNSEIDKIYHGFEELNKSCIKSTNCSLFIGIMIKLVIFNALALIF